MKRVADNLWAAASLIVPKTEIDFSALCAQNDLKVVLDDRIKDYFQSLGTTLLNPVDQKCTLIKVRTRAVWARHLPRDGSIIARLRDAGKSFLWDFREVAPIMLSLLNPAAESHKLVRGQAIIAYLTQPFNGIILCPALEVFKLGSGKYKMAIAGASMQRKNNDIILIRE